MAGPEVYRVAGGAAQKPVRPRHGPHAEQARLGSINQDTKANTYNQSGKDNLLSELNRDVEEKVTIMSKVYVV